MAVNFLLRERELSGRDPLGRTWVGWRPTATDDELWEVNRGLWSLGKQVDKERFATLSFDGRIQVVAELTGRTRYDTGDGTKWALSGSVLHPGDPIHDELKGELAPRHRNPVSYFDTAHLDSLTTAERARFVRRDPVTMIVTWNPERWNPHDWATNDYPDQVQMVAKYGRLREQWSTGSRASGIEPGDRVFFLRQGPEPRGVIGSGTATSRIFTDNHWDDERGDDAHYVLIEWDTLQLPEDGLPHPSLVVNIPEGGNWRPQGSGWVLPPQMAATLERLWAAHLGQPEPVRQQSGTRQGWQLDPVRRKKVEDAAQDRLMAHYSDRGWTVLDKRFGNPYDATATMDGNTLWLEAKGTETSGTSVIVSRNEVRWAREHAGNCVLGILSDVVFLPSGEVDPESGTFRMFNWNPDDTALSARAFDFTPAKTEQLD